MLVCHGHDEWEPGPGALRLPAVVVVAFMRSAALDGGEQLSRETWLAAISNGVSRARALTGEGSGLRTGIREGAPEYRWIWLTSRPNIEASAVDRSVRNRACMKFIRAVSKTCPERGKSHCDMNEVGFTDRRAGSVDWPAGVGAANI